MIKVLDLFAGTQSVRKALNKKYKIKKWVQNGVKNKSFTGFKDLDEMGNGINPIIEYIGIDIYSPEEENLILDLSKDNIITSLEDKLNGWKPDFIWASPLCTTFSRATCIPGGTLSYELDEKNRVKIRTKFSHITHKAYVKHKDNPEWQNQQQQKGILGLALLNNTKKIINNFDVPFAIENPAYALSKHEMTDYVRNVTHYCMYGKPYKKATAIYTNKELILRKCNHKRHEQVMSGQPNKTGIKAAPSNNKDRSVVPEDLIISIFDQSIGDK